MALIQFITRKLYQEFNKMNLLAIVCCIASIYHVASKFTYNPKFGQKSNFSGHQLWTIEAGLHQRSFLKQYESDLQIWDTTQKSVAVTMPKTSTESLGKMLKSNGIKYQVGLKDLQEIIDQESLVTQMFDKHNLHMYDWKSYQSLSEVYTVLEFLQFKYPDRVTIETIGFSVLGRPIRLVKISNRNPTNQGIFIEAGLHSNEWITTASALFMIHEILINHRNQQGENIDWYILPIANPDGYEYTFNVNRFWMKNLKNFGQCSGVDLNRNFGYQWQSIVDQKSHNETTTVCSSEYKGPGPFSEPETQAIASFLKHYKSKYGKSVFGYLALHAFGQRIAYPWSYSAEEQIPDIEEIIRIATKISSEIKSAGGADYNVIQIGKISSPLSGTSSDYAKGFLGVRFVYQMDLRDTGTFGYLLPSTFIEDTAKEVLIAATVIANNAK